MGYSAMLYNTTRKIAMRPRAGTHKRKCAVACVRIFKMMRPIVTAALQMVGARAIFGEACRRCGMQSHVTVAAAWDLLAQVISLVWVTHVGGADAWRPDVADFQQSSREPALDTLLFYEIAWYLACLVNTVVHRDPADRSTTLHHLISAVLVGVCQASNTTRVGVKMLRFFVYSTPVLHVARCCCTPTPSVRRTPCSSAVSPSTAPGTSRSTTSPTRLSGWIG